ncbi:glycosyltransferase family 4 protein [Bosea robiniae]|uniref:glycosyltransferase family 4 protein n=1 Tax=Bosea robiniae TaxID=1036780 RepID=UPI00147A3BE7|nr:glycosyltransferase family 4 protein [Bosea robiniae]
MVDGVWTGWAFDPDDPETRLSVEVWCGDRLLAAGRANVFREDLRLAAVGDGAHGFALHFDGLLPKGAIEAHIAGSVVPLPTSLTHSDIASRGAIETVSDGRLKGWVLGRWGAAVHLAIERDGRLLFAWPCAQSRPDNAAVCGFDIPLAAFLGPSARLNDLVFRIHGTDTTLALPESVAALENQNLFDPWLPDHNLHDLTRMAQVGGGRLPSSSGRRLGPHYADARAASHALIQGLERAALGHLSPKGGMPVLFGPEFLQETLDRLTALQMRLRALKAQRDWQQVAPAKASVLSEVAASSQDTQLTKVYKAIAARAAAIGHDALIAEIIEQFLPLYLDHPEERGAIARLIDDEVDQKMLSALMTAGRRNHLIDLPIEACRRKLCLKSPETLEEARHFDVIASWARRDLLTELPAAPAVRLSGLKRRGLYVLWRSPPYDSNGYAMRSHYLLRGLQAAGEDVLAVTRFGYPWDAEGKRPAEAAVEECDGVTYARLGGPLANRGTMPLTSYVEECAERIAHLAAASGADIIHSASNWLAALPALRAARLTGLPFCYEIRGLWEVTHASYEPAYEKSDQFDLFSAMEAHVARHADLVFTITHQVREEMASRGVDVSRMRIAPNGVETARFHDLSRDMALADELGIGGRLVFGYIGTFAKYEGLMDLCRAAVDLAGEGLDFRLLLVGDGPVYEEARAFVAANDRTGSIVLTGRVPFAEAPRYYSLIDVAVFPRTPTRITEMVSPLKPFEAMAMGKPVIGSDVAAIAEIIQEGRTGWLFEKGNLEALKAALRKAAANRGGLAVVGAAGRAFVEAEHDWKIIAARIAEGWRDLRARKKTWE